MLIQVAGIDIPASRPAKPTTHAWAIGLVANWAREMPSSKEVTYGLKDMAQKTSKTDALEMLLLNHYFSYRLCQE
jgi:hypothetical protein